MKTNKPKEAIVEHYCIVIGDNFDSVTVTARGFTHAFQKAKRLLRERTKGCPESRYIQSITLKSVAEE